MTDLKTYLDQPDHLRDFREGVELLEKYVPDREILIRTYRRQMHGYINKQTKLSLYIQLANIAKRRVDTQPPPPPKGVLPTESVPRAGTPFGGGGGWVGGLPVSLYATRESDPAIIKELIRSTGAMLDEAHAARNALFYLKTDADRLEYATKSVKIYRAAQQNWEYLRIFRETDALPPEMALDINNVKQHTIAQLEKKKYITERTYRLESWLSGKTKPPPQYLEEGGNIKADIRQRWQAEKEAKIQELDLINEWLDE